MKKRLIKYLIETSNKEKHLHLIEKMYCNQNALIRLEGESFYHIDIWCLFPPFFNIQSIILEALGDENAGIAVNLLRCSKNTGTITQISQQYRFCMNIKKANS